ncbi:MAG: hypothetical protein A2Z34_10250 [Planctomycetes bacterium RBG_16_59_8]|nr:MAG: hypothetical protein A2Z34_10250 [Planctomycetes bacterium RBG_16_59_8]
MRLTRYLKPQQIKLEIATRTPTEIPEGMSRERFVNDIKESVLREIVALHDASGNVSNTSKLFTDMWNREKKATTAVGDGIAIPHVRTMQAREFTLAFARSTEGVEFAAIDGEPVHFFFSVIAPPHNDALYLKVYKEMATIFGSETKVQALAAARNEHEIIKILSDFS